jgi:hypothetical protein
MGAFHDSATILVREGLEALLVLAAIGASLTRRGAADRSRAHDDLAEAGVMLSSDKRGAEGWVAAARNSEERDARHQIRRARPRPIAF